MKLNFKNQMILSIIIILFANILSHIFAHWIYRSAGFIVRGLIWIVHPVLPISAGASEKTLWWIRIAGLVNVLIGIFTRVNFI